MRSLLIAVLALAFSLSACKCGDPAGGTTKAGSDPHPGDGLVQQGDEFILDFGRVRAGFSYVQHIKFENQGRSDWKVSAASLRQGSPSSLSAEIPSLPVNYGPGEVLDIPVTFTPPLPEQLNTYLDIVSDDETYSHITVHIVGVAETPGLAACIRDASGKETCDDQVLTGNLMADFGELLLSDPPSELTLILRNSSELELHVASLNTTATTSLEFSVPSLTNLTLPPQSDKEYLISYKPADGGWDVGQIEIVSDDTNKPVLHVDLGGGGKAPKLCFKPNQLDFGGVVKDAPAVKEVQLISCGLNALEITEVSLVSGLSPNFTLATPPNLPTQLAPGTKITVPVTYTPNALAADIGKLKVVSNDPFAGTNYLKLTGNGVKEPSCQLSVSPLSVDFGLVPVSGFADKVILGANVGQKECHLTGVSAPSAPQFILKSGPGVPAILQPNDTFSMTVRYTPTGAQTDTATLTITSDDAAHPSLAVNLKGQGKAPGPCEIQLTPPALNFANVGVGTATKLPLTIYNFGTDDCMVLSAGLSSGTSNAFTITRSPAMGMGTVNRNGGKIDYEITFAPLNGGQHTGAFNARIGVDPLSTKAYSAPLSGSAGDPKICITPTVLDFGAQGPGTTAEQSFQISSCGQGAVEIRGLFMDAGTSPEFTFANKPGVPSKILAGSTPVTVTVRYSATSAGPDYGRVLVLSNDPNQSSFPVVLKGNAAGCFSSILNCTPNALNYPRTAVGLTSTLTFTCASLGTDSVDMSAIRLRAGSSAAFALSMNALPQTLAPGKSVRVAVDYSPNTATSDTGAVEIASNDCQRPLQTIALTASSFDPQYPPCIAPKTFTPTVRWEWKNPQDVPKSVSVWSTPLVVNMTDDNGDGRIDEDDNPDVVFTSFADSFNLMNGNDTPPAVLRCIDGKTGIPWWTMSDPALALDAEAQIAAGDIDGDNKPEIIASLRVVGQGSGTGNFEGKYKTGRLLAFENDGSLKWVSDWWTRGSDQLEDGSAPTITDLDGDGVPEIILGNAVYNNNGKLLWEGAAGMGTTGHGVFSTTADLDGDGKQEVIAGNTVYRYDGQVMWKYGTADGMSLVVDVDNDGKPDVVLRTSTSNIVILDGLTGAKKFEITVPDPGGTCPAPITAADFDGDGAAELGVPAGNFFYMIKPTTGAVLWKQPIQDYDGQCGASGAAAFDFEGDGIYEAVYHDTRNVFAFRGTDGTIIYQADRTSATIFETPVIADVDNDGHAEILVTQQAGPFAGVGGGGAGLKLLSNATNDWVATRRIWNEWNYHVYNTAENATIPRVEPQAWKKFNAYRANRPLCKK